MIFLTANDFKGIIADSIYTELSGTEGENADTAEGLAVSELETLKGKYRIDEELSRSASGRNKELVRIMVNMTAYYLYNTIVDVEIPERITDNFNNEKKAIFNIASGKQYSTLTRIINTESGTPKTNFRSGGDKQRSHDPFYM